MATVVTNVGKGLITARFLAAAAAMSFFIGWGTGAGTAAAADTTLFTESTEARAAATVTQVTTTSTNDTAQYVGTLTAAGARSITNAGIFDASTSGNMLMKGDFTAVALSTGDSIAFTMKIQFS
jgi:phospholipase/lecithinase/hemolysin